MIKVSFKGLVSNIFTDKGTELKLFTPISFYMALKYNEYITSWNDALIVSSILEKLILKNNEFEEYVKKYADENGNTNLENQQFSLFIKSGLNFELEDEEYDLLILLLNKMSEKKYYTKHPQFYLEGDFVMLAPIYKGLTEKRFS